MKPLYNSDTVAYMLWALIDQLVDENPDFVENCLDEQTQRWYAHYLEYRKNSN